MTGSIIVLFHFFNFTLGFIALIIISRRVSLVSAEIQKAFILQAFLYNLAIVFSAVVDFEDYFFWNFVKDNIIALSFVFLITIIHSAVYILWAFFFVQMVYKILNIPNDLLAKPWIKNAAIVLGSYLVVLLFVRIFKLYRLLYPISSIAISIVVSLVVLTFSIYMYRKSTDSKDSEHKKALKVLGILFASHSSIVLFVFLDYYSMKTIPAWILSYYGNVVNLIYNCIMIFWGFNYLNSLSTKEMPILVNNISFEQIASKYQISKRELEVVSLVCEGKSNQEIADILFISLGTVKNHLYNVYSKIGIKNRTQLAKLFQ